MSEVSVVLTDITTSQSLPSQKNETLSAVIASGAPVSPIATPPSICVLVGSSTVPSTVVVAWSGSCQEAFAPSV